MNSKTLELLFILFYRNWYKYSVYGGPEGWMELGRGTSEWPQFQRYIRSISCGCLLEGMISTLYYHRQKCSYIPQEMFFLKFGYFPAKMTKLPVKIFITNNHFQRYVRSGIVVAMWNGWQALHIANDKSVHIPQDMFNSKFGRFPAKITKLRVQSFITNDHFKQLVWSGVMVAL